MRNASEWAAVIAAGGEIEREILELTGADHKALVPFGNSTTIEIVINACLGAGLREVVVVAPEEVRSTVGEVAGVTFAEPGSNAVRSARSGLKSIGSGGPILFLAADLPLVDSPHLTEFVQRTESSLDTSSQSWFSVGLVDRDELERTYPGTPAKFIRLREGQFIASSVYGASRFAFENALTTLEEAAKNRKSMARLLFRAGLVNALKYAIGRADIGLAERTLARLFSSQVKIQTEAHPALAMDFDNAEDFRHLRSLFE